MEGLAIEGCIDSRMQGAGCRVQGSGCRVQGAGCRVLARGAFWSHVGSNPTIIITNIIRKGLLEPRKGFRTMYAKILYLRILVYLVIYDSG